MGIMPHGMVLFGESGVSQQSFKHFMRKRGIAAGKGEHRLQLGSQRGIRVHLGHGPVDLASSLGVQAGCIGTGWPYRQVHGQQERDPGKQAHVSPGVDRPVICQGRYYLPAHGFNTPRPIEPGMRAGGSSLPGPCRRNMQANARC